MEILKEIKPSKIEEAKIKKIVKDFLDRLNRRLDKAKAIAQHSGLPGSPSAICSCVISINLIIIFPFFLF